jgi:hypothetical protein
MHCGVGAYSIRSCVCSGLTARWRPTNEADVPGSDLPGQQDEHTIRDKLCMVLQLRQCTSMVNSEQQRRLRCADLRMHDASYTSGWFVCFRVRKVADTTAPVTAVHHDMTYPVSYQFGARCSVHCLTMSQPASPEMYQEASDHVSRPSQ